ncbi:Sensor histidine kinase HprS [Dyadobacter sp. CECT 9275]|uniref:histidine kinase n=2 Tax=Dyadobacter helix TaxID=2822344 RepID=A0A916N2J3_9BACT|nr:Sensor histidine kinase HprS [Dyadobacter sp. CECT 9275]
MYLIVSPVIYLAAGIAFYWIVKMMIYEEVESRLNVERRDFEAYLKTHDTWSNSSYFVENKIEVVPVFGQFVNRTIFTDTLINNRYEDSADPFRQLTFYTMIGGVPHKVSIRKSMIQSYKLIEAISVAMMIFLALLLLSMYWFHRKLSDKLWQPFYDTLSKIKQFDWTKENKLALPPTEITEFNELNDVFEKMGDKMQHDYRSLKEFTENASHEIQTPLALINARVEQFIQSKDLDAEHTYWIEEIYHASRRMSRLNQGLLLLAKIDNQQFSTEEIVDFKELTENKLNDFEDIINHRNISVEINWMGHFRKKMSPALADILLTNLINNAIRHNHEHGKIHIQGWPHAIQISNTGSELKTDPTRLFERFKKESSGPESVGLGLSIVRQICDTSGLSVFYNYQNTIHLINIADKNEENSQ